MPFLQTLNDTFYDFLSSCFLHESNECLSRGYECLDCCRALHFLLWHTTSVLWRALLVPEHRSYMSEHDRQTCHYNKLQRSTFTIILYEISFMCLLATLFLRSEKHRNEKAGFLAYHWANCLPDLMMWRIKMTRQLTYVLDSSECQWLCGCLLQEKWFTAAGTAQVFHLIPSHKMTECRLVHQFAAKVHDLF